MWCRESRRTRTTALWYVWGFLSFSVFYRSLLLFFWGTRAHQMRSLEGSRPRAHITSTNRYKHLSRMRKALRCTWLYIPTSHAWVDAQTHAFQHLHTPTMCADTHTRCPSHPPTPPTSLCRCGLRKCGNSSTSTSLALTATSTSLGCASTARCTYKHISLHQTHSHGDLITHTFRQSSDTHTCTHSLSGTLLSPTHRCGLRKCANSSTSTSLALTATSTSLGCASTAQASAWPRMFLPRKCR